MTVALRRCWGKDLDAAGLYDLLRLRAEVFVVEQQCPYPELDGQDLLSETRHFWLRDSGGEILATLRLLEEYPDERKAFRIGRVCTRGSARGNGYAHRLMQAALADVGAYPCHLNAQTYLTEMYTRHGFVVNGAEFVEDGIPHVPMLRAGRQ